MDDQRTATQRQAEPDPAPPPVNVAEPVNPEAGQPATQQQLADVEKQMTSFERATLRWAKIAVLLSGLAAVFVCAQWYEMHKGGEDTHALAQAADTQAKKMGNMSDAADKIRQAAEGVVAQEQRIADNADASNRQSRAALDASIAASRLDQRAWIGTSDPKVLQLDIGKPLYISVKLNNNGKTPALRGRAALHIRPVPSGQTLSPQDEFGEPGSIVDLFPSQSFFIHNSGKAGNVRDEEMSQITTGAVTIYVFGIVEYRDVFRIAHKTRFCYSYDAALKVMNVCLFYNEAN